MVILSSTYRAHHSPPPLTLSSLDLPSSTPARMKGLFHRGLYNFISCGLSRAIIVPRYVILLGAYLGSHCLRLCANDLNLHVYSVLSTTWSLAAPYTAEKVITVWDFQALFARRFTHRIIIFAIMMSFLRCYFDKFDYFDYLAINLTSRTRVRLYGSRLRSLAPLICDPQFRFVQWYIEFCFVAR